MSDLITTEARPLVEPPTKKRRKKHWSFSAGEYHFRVRVFENTNGVMYGEMRDTSNPCGYRCISLGHHDRTRAILWARQQSAAWMAAGEIERTATPTLSRVLALYQKHQSVGKAASERQADERRSTMWTRFLGAGKDLTKITPKEWQDFIAARRTGAIDAEANPVPADNRAPVRDATIGGDLTFLVTALNWATGWKTETGAYLLRENPVKGKAYPRVKELNPKRPVASHDRFLKVRAVSDRIVMVRGRGQNRREERSYLSEILDLVNGTGRRITAVLSLQYQDLRLDYGQHGGILWPARSDKKKKAWIAPLDQETRAAIDRILAERPGIGAAYLFQAIKNPAKPVAKETVSQWLLAAEKLAKVEKQSGGLWHPYRRKWATERKHLPDVDVAATGGWSDLSSLKTAYQQADPETMYQVVSEPRRLREVAGGQ